MVLGATNRPTDIDSAILRRMPKRFAIGLPDFQQRKKILNLVSGNSLGYFDPSADASPTDAQGNENPGRLPYGHSG